jgi:cyclic-di-GMP phosphodiesterase TipF (flagellum assembly factor)
MYGKGFYFIAACMALIAASAGVALHYAIGVTPVEAAFVALSLLFGLLAVETISARARDRADMHDRIEAVARAAADIAREFGELNQRTGRLETQPAAELDNKLVPLVREIGDLASVVEELAKSVADHESLLAQKAVFQDGPGSSGAVSLSDPSSSASILGAAAPKPAPDNPLSALPQADIAALLRDSLENDRLDIHLQPVVTLPQRKVRYYEAFSRIRLPEGKSLEAGWFIGAARATGAVVALDQRVVRHAVQIVDRLAAKSREVGIFVNLAPETLADRGAMATIVSTLEANKSLAPSLIFEIAQGDFRSPNAAFREGLFQLYETGFRFAVDRVSDLHIDPQSLADRGVRFLKVPAELLLNRAPQSGAQVHPEDLADLLGRYGIDLIAERIEAEATVVDLLDFDLGFGQGFLFAPPRPVRTDVLKAEVTEFPQPAKPEPAAAETARPKSDLSKLASKTVRRA